MRTLIRRAFAAPTAIALIVLLALPLAALANTSSAIAQTGGMTVTLPMAGSGLSVVVQLDVGGNVSQVDLDPVGTFTATKLGPHAVTFDTSDGTSQVKINAHHDKLEVKASAPTLETLLGSGSWSADLFGSDEMTTVGYTIGAATDGSPTVAIDSVSAPGDVVVVQAPPKTHSGPKHVDASAKIAFSRDGFTKKLEIKVSVKSDHDKTATLKISLTGKDKQTLKGALADFVGTRTWSGAACDGTAIGFSYDVATDGSIAFGTATGLPATSKTHKNGLHVEFAAVATPATTPATKAGHHDKTKVTVHLNEKKDATWELKVDAKSGHCHDIPVADPTVNTPIAPDATKGHDGHDDHATVEKTRKADKADKAAKAARAVKAHQVVKTQKTQKSEKAARADHRNDRG